MGLCTHLPAPPTVARVQQSRVLTTTPVYSSLQKNHTAHTEMEEEQMAYHDQSCQRAYFEYVRGTYMDLCSLTSHTLLQREVCSHCNHWVVAMAETWYDQSDLCSSQIASVVMEYNYITMCLVDVSILLSVTRPFLSLRRVWLARLRSVFLCYMYLIRRFSDKTTHDYRARQWESGSMRLDNRLPLRCQSDEWLPGLNEAQVIDT